MPISLVSFIGLTACEISIIEKARNSKESQTPIFVHNKRFSGNAFRLEMKSVLLSATHIEEGWKQKLS